jgi:uncharacterized protein
LLPLSACNASNNDTQTPSPTPSPTSSPTTPETTYPAKLIMTTTAVGGALQVYGATTASIIEKYTGVAVAPTPTSGGAELLNLMLRGESQMCTSTSTNLVLAMQGVAPFPESPDIVRGFSGAYTSFAHFLVRADSDIMGFEDLKGKRLMFERPGEANFANVYPALLKAYGIELSDVTILPALAYAEATTALKQNQADCIFQWSGVPSPQFLELSKAVPIRYLSMSEAAQNEVIKSAPFLFPGVVSGGTYDGTPDDTNVLGLLGWIGIRADVSEEFAYDAIKAVCENMGELNVAHSKFSSWTPQDLVANPSVPYHSGVYKYYKEAGLITPEWEQKHKDLLAQFGQEK